MNRLTLNKDEHLATQDVPTVKPTDGLGENDADVVRMVRTDHLRARMSMANWYSTSQRCYDYVYGKQASDDKNMFFLVLNLIIHRFLTKAGILTAGKPVASITGRDVDDDDAGQIMKDLVEYGIEKGYLDKLISNAVQDQLICGLGVLDERFAVHKKRWTETHGYVPGLLSVTLENPFHFAFDPDNESETMDGDNGPQYITKISKVMRKKLQMQYPKKAALIGVASSFGDMNDLKTDSEDRSTGTYGAGQNDKQSPRPTDKLVVIEYWYKKLISNDIVLKVYKNDDGTPGRTDIARLPTMEQVAQFPEFYNIDIFEKMQFSEIPVDELGLAPILDDSEPELPGQIEAPGQSLEPQNHADENLLIGTAEIEYPYSKYGEPGSIVDPKNIPPIEEDEGGVFEYDVVRTFDEEMWTAAIVGDVLLYHKRSPYRHNRWPYVFFTGMLRRGEPCPYGQIDPMLVPQDVINANLSLIQDNASRINNPGRIIKPDGIIAGQRGRILDIVANPGWTLIMEEGSPLSVNDVYKEVVPGTMPAQLLEFTDYLRRMIDEIASVAQVQRGGMPYDTSGKAIQSLLQASDTALSTVQRNIEYSVTVWGENRVKNIQQFYTLEDSIRISDDLRAYRIAFEHYTNPETEKTSLSLVKYPEGDPGEPPPAPKRIFEDFSVAEFDIRVGVKTNQERDPDDVTTRNLGYFDRGIVDEQYVIENDDRLTGKRELLKRIMKKKKDVEMLKNFSEMMEGEGPEAALLRASQNPDVAAQILQILGQMGIDQDTLDGMVSEAEAAKEEPQAATQQAVGGAAPVGGVPVMGGGVPNMQGGVPLMGGGVPAMAGGVPVMA